MTFYQLWNIARNHGISEDSFIKDFINSTDQSNEVFYNGKTEDLVELINVLLNTKLESLIEYIVLFDKNISFSACNILQFSNFRHGIYDVPKFIEFAVKPLSFKELGKKLFNSKKANASIKYGENHAKLAAEFSLVKLDSVNSKCITVDNTYFGKVFLTLNDQHRLELIKRLSLRNLFFRFIIKNSFSCKVDYEKETCNVLSKSTAIRRRSNVKYILTLILKDTDYNYLLNNIVW